MIEAGVHVWLSVGVRRILIRELFAIRASFWTKHFHLGLPISLEIIGALSSVKNKAL